MKAPTAGQLRHRIRLEVEVRVNDGSGGYLTTWAIAGNLWAALTDTSYANRQTHGLTEHTLGVTALLRVAPLFGLTPLNVDRYRIAYRGELYKVLSLNPLGMRKEYVSLDLDRWGGTATPTAPVNDGSYLFDNTIQF